MNCNTQNTKIANITEKTLIIGIDIGSENHYARAFDWRNYEYSRQALCFSNSEAGFQTLLAWITDLKEKTGKTEVIPGMEPTGHYWFALGKFLQDQGMRPVHVNPHHVKKSKELDDNHPSKNDRKDPKTIAALVNEGRYMYPFIPEGIYAEIRNLSNLRFEAQEELTRAKNRTARWFAIYFPEYKDVYGDLKAVGGRMILRKAPLPQDIVKLGAEGINRIWRDAKLRGAGKKRAETLYAAAEHSIGNREAPEAARLELEQLLDDIDRYEERLKKVTELMEEKLREVPYIDKLLEIKGIGMTTVSGFVAEVGDIRRFNDPKQVQKLAGYAITANESGKYKGESHISHRGRKRLRYVLYEAAVSVVGKNEEFKKIHEYYRMRTENPLKKMESVVAVACKLIRVFYTILTKGVSYDGSRMLGDIRRPQAVIS